MKLNLVLAGIALLDATATAIAIPESGLTSSHSPAQEHAQRDDASTAFFSDLWRRKGGGGSGGKGGSSGSSSSGGKTGSSSSSGSSGSSSSSSKGLGSSSSSTGGRTTTGSGAAASYGGGRYYGGGTTVPYRSGVTSTGGLIALPLLAGSALLFWPGVWLHGAYLYPYTSPWRYHNASTNQNETKPVTCGCEQYQECGCDNNNGTDYITSVLGNGSYNQLNQSLVTVASVNGTETILLNGTLPNGTTASGGTDSASAGVSFRHLSETAGYWPMAATVLVVALL